MAELTELKATAREGTGKLANRALRAQKMVPGVVYGGETAPANVALEYKNVWLHYQTGHFLSTVYMLDVDGKKERVIPREVQVDPVRDFPIHVDFMRVSRSSRIDVDVPVQFINEEASPGLKRTPLSSRAQPTRYPRRSPLILRALISATPFTSRP